VSSDQAERRGRDLLAAIRRGLELPESDLPRLIRPPRRVPDLAYEERLERLKAARNRLAQEHDLAPGVVCPNGTLEAIARLDPKTAAALGGVTELRRWQLREFGDELLQALRGPAAQDGGG
jgi:ribonuclease D